MISNGVRSLLRTVPKVELHVHLEGSTPAETLLRLARKNGVPIPASSVEEVREWYRFRDFPHFAEVYRTICRCIRSAEDIETLLREFLRSQYAQNIIYTEVTFTALTHLRNYRISLDDQLKALDRARCWAERHLGVYCGVIVDIPREQATEQESKLIADWVGANWGETIIALGLGGYEVGFPPEMFSEAFDRAARFGVPAVIHAGETEGPASIWGAIRALNAVRIGHGVRALEDPMLVEHLRDNRVPLEVCISSNVCLGVAADHATHPLRSLMENGLNVTINTDDPPMFGTDLARELEQAMETVPLGTETVADLLQAALTHSLASPATKQALNRRLERPLSSLRELGKA